MTVNEARRIGNWGRWGVEDQRGSANLLTPSVVLAALDVPVRGTVIPLGTEVGKRGALSGGRNATWHVTTRVDSPQDPGRGRAEDMLTMHTHAHSHLDGLGHVWYDGGLYNGVSPAVIGRGGARRLGVDQIGGIVTRGLLLDLTQGGGREWGAGELIEADDLSALCATAEFEPRSGDALMIRTGWFDKFLEGDSSFYDGEPGLSSSALEWITQREPTAVGLDNFAGECMPAPVGLNPLLVHETLLRDYGIYMLELLNFRALALAGATAFLFVAAPLMIDQGLGSPINPLAVI
jgi:kynurenine formamidase